MHTSYHPLAFRVYHIIIVSKHLGNVYTMACRWMVEGHDVLDPQGLVTGIADIVLTQTETSNIQIIYLQDGKLVIFWFHGGGYETGVGLSAQHKS